jgi:dihydroneopterin aldolase
MSKKPKGDRIILKGLAFYGYHGVLSEEAKLGQRFIIDLQCGTDLSVAGATDDLEVTISYAAIYDVVKAAFEDERYKLIEAVAQHITDRLFASFAQINWIKLRVRKPGAPIAMVTGEAAIEIIRFRIKH